MKTLLYTIALLVGIFAQGIAQTQIKLTENFVGVEDCFFAEFAFKGPTNVIVWDEPTIKITTTINAPEVTLKTLEAIVKEGRYEIGLNFYEEERAMIFEMPQTEKKIMVNGFDFREYLEFEIHIPKHLNYQLVYPVRPAFL